MGTLAGIGFTMSIFTTMLAFSEEVYRDIARIAILLAVVVSVIVSLIYFRIVNGKFAVPAQLGSTQLEPPSQVPQPGINAA
ncbi:Na+/H+ antiporter NhaA [Puia sp. P3]|uniref:Na+/H+ antiporter NhaA n=1 Tax=Puia sp. P3 TaxID=3423952 RepID=UPI003D67C8C0